MTQQHEPDLPNERAVEPTGGLFVDLQRARSEAEREESAARVGDDIQTAEYLKGCKSGLDLALTILSDSVWKPEHILVGTDEEAVLSIEVLINKKSGHVISRSGGQWDDHDEFDDVFDLIVDAAREIIGLNPEEYVTDPEPRAVRLRQETVPAMDTFFEPLMLSADEVAASRFVYSDGQLVTLILPDGQTVRVERGDIEVEPIES